MRPGAFREEANHGYLRGKELKMKKDDIDVGDPVELSTEDLDTVAGGTLNIQNISQFVQQLSSGINSTNTYFQSASITQS